MTAETSLLALSSFCIKENGCKGFSLVAEMLEDFICVTAISWVERLLPTFSEKVN